MITNTSGGHGVSVKMAELRHAFTSAILLSLIWQLIIECVSAAPNCSPSEIPISVHPTPAGSLEDALRGLDHLHNCTVQLYLLSGVHVISSGVAVSAASVALSSHPNNTDRPVVRCGDNMSHPGESVNETEEVGFLTFWKGAREVNISGVDFEGCPRTVQFIEVDSVSIRDCTFSNFTQGPVNIYNCVEVQVTACTFQHNQATSVFRDLPFRIAGGGISFALTSNQTVQDTTVHRYTIRACTFLNNSANSTLPPLNISGVLSEQYLNGRGGGLAMFVNHPSFVAVRVFGCNFTANSANMFAGGLYLFPFHIMVDKDFEFIGNHFEGNIAPAGGGSAFGVPFGQRCTSATCATVRERVRVEDSTFLKNIATYGAALRLAVSISELIQIDVTIRNCTFRENIAYRLGAAVSMSLRQAFPIPSREYAPVFDSNVFDSNECASGGIVNVFQYSIEFQGRNIFVNNVGPVLQVTKATVDISGDMLWMNNTAPMAGAAVDLTSHAQLRLHPSANLTFVSNKGNFGAAIRAQQLRTVSFLGEALYNPMCFITFTDRQIVAGKQNVSFSFINNTALFGAAMLLNDVVQCSFVRSGNNRFSLEETFRSNNFWYSGNSNTGQTEPDNAFYDIATPPVRVRGNTSAVMAYPGQSFSIPIGAFDELNQPAAGVFSVHEMDVVTNMHTPIRLVPDIRVVLPKEASFQMFYLAPNESSDRKIHTLRFEDVFSGVRTGPTNITQVPLLPRPCPPGFVIRESFTTGFVSCQCDNSSSAILTCDINTEEITLKEETWALSLGLSETQDFQILQVYPCPAGYCRCVLPLDLNGPCTQVFTNNSALDAQCSCHRSGFLCGSCSNGTGVTALLDQCERCSPVQGLLVAALVITDTVVILGVMVVSLWKPLHLLSWLYPFLFFFQVAPLATRGFFVTFRLYNAPLFYLGSLLGLYFPYDFCLYPNATAVEVYAIKYIPLILASIICPSVIVAARCRGIKVNYSGVWLILMLLFNQVVYTSASVLNCPRLTDESGAVNSVWFVDGTVKCFTGGHIPLALWAIFCLLLCVAAIFVPLIGLRHRKPEELPLRLRVLKEAVAHPFREDLPHWYLVELMRRTLLIVVIVAVHGKESGPSFLVMVYFCLYAYALPYKDTVANILECTTLALLLVLLLGGTVPIDNSGVQTFYNVTYDECGSVIPFGNHISSMMAAVFYLPVLLLVLVIVAKLCTPLVKRCRSAVEGTGSTQIAGVRHFTYKPPMSEAMIELVQHSSSYSINTTSSTAELQGTDM